MHCQSSRQRMRRHRARRVVLRDPDQPSALWRKHKTGKAGHAQHRTGAPLRPRDYNRQHVFNTLAGEHRLAVGHLVPRLAAGAPPQPDASAGIASGHRQFWLGKPRLGRHAIGPRGEPSSMRVDVRHVGRGYGRHQGRPIPRGDPERKQHII